MGDATYSNQHNHHSTPGPSFSQGVPPQGNADLSTEEEHLPGTLALFVRASRGQEGFGV